MEHAYTEDLYQILDLVKANLDQNELYRFENLKQNCEWNKAEEDEKKIYFATK